MISVFDTNPVIFESNDRTLTISYNGVLVEIRCFQQQR